MQTSGRGEMRGVDKIMPLISSEMDLLWESYNHQQNIPLRRLEIMLSIRGENVQDLSQIIWDERRPANGVTPLLSHRRLHILGIRGAQPCAPTASDTGEDQDVPSLLCARSESARSVIPLMSAQIRIGPKT